MPRPRYVSNMGDLFKLSEADYVRFLKRVAAGMQVHEALPISKWVGQVVVVTDMDARDANFLLKEYEKGGA